MKVGLIVSKAQFDAVRCLKGVAQVAQVGEGIFGRLFKPDMVKVEQ